MASSRTGMSKVKFQVRHNALLLREFTVADMVRATGLNPESIRTELQRMKKERLVTSHPSSEKPKKRGGRQTMYRLTDDPEARLILSKSIEAFYSPPPPSDQPTSRYYLSARQLLNLAQTADDLERKRLLAIAEHDLEMAEQAEGGNLASEPVRAYLLYESARLAYLRGEYEVAWRRFDILSEFFAVAQDETMVSRIREYQLCMEVRERFVAVKMDDMGGPAKKVRFLLDALDDKSYRSDSPLVMLLLELLRSLSQPPIEKVLVDLVRALVRAAEVRRELGEIRESFRVERMHSLYGTIVHQLSERSPMPDLPQGEKLLPLRPVNWSVEDLVGRPPPR